MHMNVPLMLIFVLTASKVMRFSSDLIIVALSLWQILNKARFGTSLRDIKGCQAIITLARKKGKPCD
jgi:hypothetical protein